ncbi:MAG TPA: DUF3311 domain-containing protein [Streptosporangiaceae bacterium]|jgi:hypothetical protein
MAQPPSDRRTDGLPAPPATRRPALWLLLVPVVLYGVAPFVANRIEPRVFGIPFLLFWIIAATVVSPLVIWLASRLDPVFRAGSVEPVPADDDPHGEDAGGDR